jgi:hypothetical protein
MMASPNDATFLTSVPASPIVGRPPRVLITRPFLAPAAMELLEEQHFDILTMPVALNSDPVIEILRREKVDALIVHTTPVDARAIDAADGVKVISRAGAGVDPVDLDAATRRGIPVFVAYGANSRSVAEHSLPAIKAADAFGGGSPNPSGPAARVPRQTGRTHDRFRTRSDFLPQTTCNDRAVHTRGLWPRAARVRASSATTSRRPSMRSTTSSWRTR